jgi:hypothetical protein
MSVCSGDINISSTKNVRVNKTQISSAKCFFVVDVKKVKKIKLST